MRKLWEIQENKDKLLERKRKNIKREIGRKINREREREMREREKYSNSEWKLKRVSEGTRDKGGLEIY